MADQVGRHPATAAYKDLGRQGADRCGLVELATRTVGAPFVCVVAATLVRYHDVVRRARSHSPNITTSPRLAPR